MVCGNPNVAKSPARFVVALFALASWATWLTTIVHNESLFETHGGGGCGVWECKAENGDTRDVTDTNCDDLEKLAKVVQAFSIITMIVMTPPTLIYLVTCFSDAIMFGTIGEMITRFLNPAVWICSLIAWAIVAAEFNREYCNVTMSDHSQLSWGFGLMVFTTAVWLFLCYVGFLCHEGHIFSADSVTCMEEGCEDRPAHGCGGYCQVHDPNNCQEPGCTDKGKYNGYCNKHDPNNCTMAGCTNKKKANADYCEKHDTKCEHPGCNKTKIGKAGAKFCDQHDPKCQHGGCNSHKEFPNDANQLFCAKHHPMKCKHDSCEKKGREGPYCEDHECIERGCNVIRASGEQYCKTHIPKKCTEYGCSNPPDGHHGDGRCKKHTTADCANAHCRPNPKTGGETGKKLKSTYSGGTGRYCETCSCTERNCLNKGEEGGFCRSHQRCRARDCSKAAAHNKVYCEEHSCAHRGCDKETYTWHENVPYGQSGDKGSDYCKDHMGGPLAGFKLKDKFEASGASDEGLEVSHIVAGGPAEHADIREGDQVLYLTNTTSVVHSEQTERVIVDEQYQFKEFMQRNTSIPGSKVVVTLVRGPKDGEPITKTLILGEKKGSSGASPQRH